MKKIIRNLLCTVTALIMIVSFFTVGASAAVKINTTNVEVPIGYYTTLKVTGTTEKVKFSAGNDCVSVKEIDDYSAKITGKKKGTCYIYVSAGSKSFKCKVTVKKSFISANKDNIELNKGNSQTITLTVKGSKEILVSNSDKSVCTTSWGKWSDNKITLKITSKKAGTAKLSIYPKGESASAKTITVKVSDPKTEAAGTSDMEDEVVKLVNKEREAKGLPALTQDDKLSRVADVRAKEIVEKFEHTRPDGSRCFTAFNDEGIVNVYMGENIAAWQKTASEVMDSWMSSAGHKANILSSDYTRIGVGCYESGGKYYWIQEFSSDY